MSVAEFRCAICGRDYRTTGRPYGNSPAPLRLPEGSRICDRCNASYALRARLGQRVIGPDGALLFDGVYHMRMPTPATPETGDNMEAKTRNRSAGAKLAAKRKRLDTQPVEVQHDPMVNIPAGQRLERAAKAAGECNSDAWSVYLYLNGLRLDCEPVTDLSALEERLQDAKLGLDKALMEVRRLRDTPTR